MSPIVGEKCPQCGGDLPAAAEQIICQYCGSRLIRQTTSTGGGKTAEGPPTIVHGMRLKTFAYVDAQGVGAEAFRMLIPSAWEFSGGIQWTMANPGLPAVLAFQVRNPGGGEAFEVFPAQPFFWTNEPMSRMTFPQGSYYFGNEVQPPAGALQALKGIAVPRFRGGVGGVQIVEEQSLPELPGQLRVLNPAAQTGNVMADGARVRLRYALQEQSVDESLFGVVQAQRMTTPAHFGAIESIFWTLDYLFSFRAPTERLDGLADLFQTILYSFRLNTAWFNAYLQISQQMIQGQIQNIRQIGQLSRYVSQTSNQISDMIMDSYNQRQATMDRLADSFSQAIRGVDEYRNPFEDRPVELPGGYDHAWANALGEYIVTDDPNFNPNLGSNSNWEPLSRQ